MKISPWRSPVGAWLEASDRHADRWAITDEDLRWTHATLRGRAFNWAASIAAASAPGDHIALHLEHSAEAVAALLGTLLAGRVFVALDPQRPAAVRVAQLQYSEATLLIHGGASGAGLVSDLPWNGRSLYPERSDSQMAVREHLAVLYPETRAGLQFTSGSSGSPKAVVWSHATLARAADHLQAMFDFGPEDRHATLAPLSVASTVAQWLAALAAGAELQLRDARRCSISELGAWLSKCETTTLQTVPSLFRSLVRDRGRTWPRLRAVKLGGEAVTGLDARLFDKVAPEQALLINGLGLTEAGFNVCWCIRRKGEAPVDVCVPIGRPPAGIEIEVESSPGTPVALGETGELVIRAQDMADGYWRNPEATARVFRDLGDRPGWRELRTGDLGRLRGDGLLDHVGRLDDRVKIRGHTVDPSEVTSALLSLEGVRDAVTLAMNDDDAGRLCAFVELEHAAGFSTAELKRDLSERLPDFMVPAELRRVEGIPRLPGGKPDRVALTAWPRAERSEGETRPPRDELERTLHALFSRALPHRSFGVAESFFDLGGDSLGAAKMFASIGRVLGVDLALSELSLHQSVEQLAKRIRAGGWNTNDHPLVLLTPSPCSDAVPLFIWPGAGSDVMALADLARHLGPSVALHAVQHRGADGRRVYDVSVAAMAARGAALVRKAQPEGPYALCGTSFGGLVALEVARHIRAMGESVYFVGLLDTYAPGYPVVRHGLSLADRVQLALRALRPIGCKDEPGLANLRRGVCDRWQRLLARQSIHVANPSAPPLTGPGRYLHLQEACFVASRAYRPESCDQDVHLFRVEAQPPARLFERDDSLGWTRWQPGRLRIETIPGRHGEHIREPHVQVLAERLRTALAQARRQTASIAHASAT